MNVEDGGELTLEGTINNSGTINLISNASSAAELSISGYVTLAGDGSVVPSSGTPTTTALPSILSAGAGATLATSNDIAGIGRIGDGDTTLTLINEQGGVIDGTGSTPLVINTGTNVITNDGTLETAVANGVLQIESDVDNLGGTVAAICTDAATNSLVALDRMTIAGGTLTTSGTGDIDTVYATLDGASQGTLTNSGTLEVLGTVTLEGTIANTGSVLGSELINVSVLTIRS